MAASFTRNPSQGYQAGKYPVVEERAGRGPRQVIRLWHCPLDLAESRDDVRWHTML